jgi:cytochrome c biogenesis protein CcdA
MILMSILTAVLTGLLAGSLHVLMGPDHLAAIAPFTADTPKRSWRIGLWWGIGHTASIGLVGTAVFLTRALLPLERLSLWSELAVGAVLIGLGIWGVRKAVRTRVHYHMHQHGEQMHAHFHTHERSQPRHWHEHHGHEHSHAPLGIGIVHGLAGSSHFWGILPALAFVTAGESVGYISGFGIGSICSIVVFSWLLGRLVSHFSGWSADAYRWIQIGFSMTAIIVGVVWLL